MPKKGVAAMPLFSRFLQAIKSLLPAPLSNEQLELLSQLDTHQIYVENVRSLLGVSYREAVDILETAVRQGVFTKKIGVVCPDGSVGASAETEDNLPATTPCFKEDEDGLAEEFNLPTQTLKKVVFYSLDESSKSASYSRTA
jgi:hypothetical protein